MSTYELDTTEPSKFFLSKADVQDAEDAENDENDDDEDEDESDDG
jgi:hypothetical protein